MSSAAVETANKGNAPANQAFRFMDLPVETRSNIYAKGERDYQGKRCQTQANASKLSVCKVLEDIPKAVLRSDNKGKLSCRSALPRVCRVVRQEFLSILYLSVDVEARVMNWDFGHIVTFFNQLQDAELRALPSLKSSSNRDITIKLHSMPAITTREMYHYQHHLNERIDRWLNRIEHPTKKGVHANISYARGTWATGDAHRWIAALKQKQNDITSDKKWNELNKIVAALR